MTRNKRSATVHIVAGPTAGGKSARAVELARELDGVVINCDSLQIYDGLPILTAQPDAQDRAAAPHALYGVLHPNEACSAGIWRGLAISLIEEALRAGQTPIICGGTGLYIKALTEGLSPIPEIPDEIRATAVKKQKELGNPGFHAELQKRDPVMAARFHPLHTARLVRAWEVLEATGKSLAEWQAQSRLGPPDHWRFEIHKIMPEREILRQRCDSRFLDMLERGALEEVKSFAARIENGEIEASAALTKALGFKPLLAHLRGEIDLAEAIDRAQIETRQYAKRQTTWFRNQV